MTIEAALRTKLTGHAPLVALVKQRIWWNEAKSDAERPSVIVTRASCTTDQTLDGSSGLKSATYTISIVTDQTKSAHAASVGSQIRAAVEAALDGFRGTVAGVTGITILDIELTDDRLDYLADTDAGETGTVATILTFRVDYEETN